MRQVIAAIVGLLMVTSTVPPTTVPPTSANERPPRAGAAGQRLNAAAGATAAGATAAIGSSRPAAPKEQPVTPESNNTESNNTETAVFAGGCFWCTELAFEQLAGVLDVESGYCGGTKASANYKAVHRGKTDHAEAIRVTYDPTKVSYDRLLSVFFDAHDPTQLNRQGEDNGRQYRSAIFFANDQQKEQAEAKIADLTRKRAYARRIVTKLEPLTEFFPAEGYHQDFARRNLLLPYIRSHAIPKAGYVRNKHPDLVSPGK